MRAHQGAVVQPVGRERAAHERRRCLAQASARHLQTGTPWEACADASMRPVCRALLEHGRLCPDLARSRMPPAAPAAAACTSRWARTSASTPMSCRRPSGWATSRCDSCGDSSSALTAAGSFMTAWIWYQTSSLALLAAHAHSTGGTGSARPSTAGARPGMGGTPPVKAAHASVPGDSAPLAGGHRPKDAQAAVRCAQQEAMPTGHQARRLCRRARPGQQRVLDAAALQQVHIALGAQHSQQAPVQPGLGHDLHPQRLRAHLHGVSCKGSHPAQHDMRAPGYLHTVQAAQGPGQGCRLGVRSAGCCRSGRTHRVHCVGDLKVVAGLRQPRGVQLPGAAGCPAAGVCWVC